MKQLCKVDSQGFTLVEILTVLVLMGILVAVAVPKFIDLSKEARLKAAIAGVAEYNGREKVLWARVQLAGGEALSSDKIVDQTVFGQMDFNLDSGTDDDWDFEHTGGAAGSVISARLTFKGEELSILRTPATLQSPGVWRASSSPVIPQDPRDRLIFNMEYLVDKIDNYRANEENTWPFKWNQDPYEELNLDKDQWEGGDPQVLYEIEKGFVKIRPKKGYKMFFEVVDGSTKRLSGTTWQGNQTQTVIWYNIANKKWSHISGDNPTPEQEIKSDGDGKLPESFQIVEE